MERKAEESSGQSALQGRTVIITGAAQGIGRAITEKASREGAANLLLVDLPGKELGAIASKLAPSSVGIVEGDLSNHEIVQSIVPEAIRIFGQVDGLVNSAGVSNRTPLLDSDISQWEHIFAVNSRAPYFLMRDFVRHRQENGGGGSAVNVLSMNAHRGTPELPIYSASKAALGLLTRNLAHSFGASKIRFNGINVGWVDTPAERQMQRDIGHADNWLDEVGASQPFGRLLLPDDVARLVVFLLGDESYPMTGSIVDQEQVVVGGR